MISRGGSGLPSQPLATLRSKAVEGGGKGLQREEVTPEWANGVQVGVEAGRMERPRREGVGLSETAPPLGLKTALLVQMRSAQSLLRAGWQAGPGDPSRILICHLSLQLLWQY